eukprot:5448533-Pleurochrysis_carterae.AAC.4
MPNRELQKWGGGNARAFLRLRRQMRNGRAREQARANGRWAHLNWHNNAHESGNGWEIALE